MFYVYLLFFLVGAALWTLGEYLMHRFVGHGVGLKVRFAKEHKTHHARPGYFTPVFAKIWMSLMVLVPLYGLFSLVFGLGYGTALIAGFTASYVWYEWVHYSLHAFAPMTTFGHALRKHHFCHHFHNGRKNHGVTFPIFDHLFGTFITPPGQLLVPRGFEMKWLVDPSTGAVKPQYQQDYALRQPRKRATS